MTLQEAYELRHRELLSLRAENLRLKKQLSYVLPTAEKDALEHRIAQLKQSLERAYGETQSARANWRRARQKRQEVENENLALREQIASLEKEVDILRIRAEKAEEEVRMLNGTTRRLEKKAGMSYENSSLPSSAFPFRKKIPNSRKPTGRKRGGQPGHRPHTASRLQPTREPVRLPVPNEFTGNPDIYPTGRTITKQVVDIRIAVDVQDYVADEYRNRVTGARLHAPFPAGVVNDVSYGPSVKALAFLLNNYYNVPVAKTAQCISDVTGGVIRLSAGTVCNLSAEFSAATQAERARIFSMLTHADVLYSDATVSNINGTRKAVILCTDKEQVLYQHLDHKGHDGLSQTPVMNCEGTIVHDHDRTYYSYGRGHQECLAHVLRYLTGAMENEPHLAWHRQMHSLLQRMIHLRKHSRNGLAPDKVRDLVFRYEAVLDTAADEYAMYPPAKEYMDGYNLHKRMREYQAYHLYFLRHSNVDYTNNICERGLRRFKRKLKQAVVLRSDTGGQRICNALTIIETARMQNRNVYDTAVAAFTK